MRIIGVEPYEVQTEDVTLSLMIWRRYRRPMRGLLAALLALDENQHLEHQNATLTPGTIVYMPVVDLEEFPELEVVSLWD